MRGSIETRLAVVIAVVALAAVVFPVGGAASVAGHFKGLVAVAEYTQVDETGCIVTDLQSLAATGRQTISGQGSGLVEEVDAFVLVTNVCEGSEVAFLVCSSFPDGSAAVSIDRALTSGTASGSMTCTNFDTGDTCELSKSETFRGLGDLSTIRNHVVDRFDAVVIVDSFRVQLREAEVAAATISGCGLSFTESDAVSAQLQNSSDTFVQIVRP
jgi:hypothetical protein